MKTKHTNLSSLIFDAFGGVPGVQIERLFGNTYQARVQGFQRAIRLDAPDLHPPLGTDVVAHVLGDFDAQHEDTKIDLWKRFRQYLPEARALAPAYLRGVQVMAECRAEGKDLDDL